VSSIKAAVAVTSTCVVLVPTLSGMLRFKFCSCGKRFYVDRARFRGANETEE
jgi:hypothetical protein